jgi:hypothetical protein
MNNLETTYTEITDWQKNVYLSTGGTRSKYIALHPNNNEEYFFKGSKIDKQGNTLYPTEFWSEIVSSKIGHLLGFNMLDYNIAYDKNHNQKIGCLSKTMVLNSENKLTEGITYLTGYNSNYNPELDKKKYTFQFIEKALFEFDLKNYIFNIIEIIIFDAIVGNSDRHQENWGVILYYRKAIEDSNNELKYLKLSFWGKIKKKFLKLYHEASIYKIKEKGKISKTNLKLHSEITPHQFAPIYDSGCCLGRERDDKWVSKALLDSDIINNYINKGQSEIHWEDEVKKCNHFDLVKLLLEYYPERTRMYINRVIKEYNKDNIKEIIDNIDKNLPITLINFKLSNSRKELMFKLITLRIEKLQDLI